MRGRPTSRLGNGLVARSSRAAACGHARSRARSVRPRCGHLVRDGAVTCLSTARRRLTDGEVHPESTNDSSGDAGQGGQGWRVPERRGGGEAEEGVETAAFADWEGAPMGGDGGCGVLQHRCGKGKRELASIWEWRSSEGTHRRGGRQRRCSAKSGCENSGEGAGAREGVGEDMVTGERTRVSVMFEWLGRRHGREGKRRGEQGVVQPWGGATRCGGRSWGLAPTVSRSAVTRARRAWAARRCSDRGTSGADGWAPVAVRTGRE
jgi:hypothetical protein